VAHLTHTNEPVPFLIYAPGIEPDETKTFDEVACKSGAYGLLEKDGFIREVMRF
jgi:2,3-bisphosphoglycerate-independent phosphoglycerate mutase